MRILLVAVLVIGAISQPLPARAPLETQPSIQGVWRVAEIRDAQGVNSQPQPGLYIFTTRHYSLVQVLGREPRKAPADVTTATAAELLAVFGPSFNAQSGTYTASATSLTLRPIVAKQPNGMAPGSTTVYGFKVQGSDLTLTGSNRGGVTYRLTRAE